MKLRRIFPLGATALILFILAAIPLPHAKGDKLIFGDGFIVEGRVKEEMMPLIAPGLAIAVPKPGQPFWLEDDARKIYFAPFQAKEAIKDREKKPDQIKLTLFGPQGKNSLPLNWSFESATKWNEHWEREATLNVGGKKLKVKQRITSLTPEGMRVETATYDWICHYSTKEFDPEMLRDLMSQYPLKKKEKDIDTRITMYRFFLQAGFTESAEQELNSLMRDYPKEDSKLAPMLDGLKRVYAVQIVEGLDRAQKANLHNEVQQKLDLYAKRQLADLVDGNTQLRVQAIKDKIDLTNLKVKEARRLLAAFVEMTPAGQRDFFKSAAKDIVGELNPDTVARLETFLYMAADYERAVKDKRPLERQPEQSAAEVLAFALTGWLRGSDAAEKSVELAVTQWEGRLMLLEYLKCDDVGSRKSKLLPALTAKTNVDEAMQILKHLPPVDPFEKISTKGQDVQTANNGRPFTYHLQLPPGYHHGRNWPVLVVLHHAQEKAAEAASRWTALAAEHGYILAAPQWGKGPRNEYQFSSTEHAAVLETLKDLRRRFQIDSDRVYLFGLEYGGNMAFDVGLSHPDQFAGVMPMAGAPLLFAKRYWTNGQYLNFYIIGGERAGFATKETFGLMKDQFIKYNYPAIYVEYKGRQAAWFGAELPTLFDWMNRKRRANPLKELGKDGHEFRTHRNSDTQFFWLSTKEVLSNRINVNPGWNSAINPGTLRGTVFSNNEINVKTNGVGPVTIWCGPKFVNYGEKVSIKVNGSAPLKVTVTPNLETLLETLYHTGDRQRLYFAKVEMKS